MHGKKYLLPSLPFPSLSLPPDLSRSPTSEPRPQNMSSSSVSIGPSAPLAATSERRAVPPHPPLPFPLLLSRCDGSLGSSRVWPDSDEAMHWMATGMGSATRRRGLPRSGASTWTAGKCRGSVADLGFRPQVIPHPPLSPAAQKPSHQVRMTMATSPSLFVLELYCLIFYSQRFKISLAV